MQSWPRGLSRAAESSLPTLREVLGVGVTGSQGRLDVSLGCARAGRALPGQSRWVVGRSWQLWERKSEPEFVMPLLKELSCKRSDSKLTQMSGLSSGTREGLFLSPLLMHTKDKGAADQPAEGQNHFQEIPLHVFQ